MKVESSGRGPRRIGSSASKQQCFLRYSYSAPSGCCPLFICCDLQCCCRGSGSSGDASIGATVTLSRSEPVRSDQIIRAACLVVHVVSHHPSGSSVQSAPNQNQAVRSASRNIFLVQYRFGQTGLHVSPNCVVACPPQSAFAGKHFFFFTFLCIYYC